MKDKFIVLTHEMIRDESMTMQEKIIYMEILNLSSLEKGCIASNSHFEKCFGISKKSVSNTIANLVKKELIESRLYDRNHTRILSIKDGQVSIKDGQVSIKDGETKENKTINKTKNISIDIVSSFFDENRDIKKDDKSIKIMSDFVTYRKQIKKPIKSTGNLKLYYNKLKELHIDGFDIDKCIEEMKTREWQMIDKEYLKNRKDLKVSNSKVIGNTSNDSVLI